MLRIYISLLVTLVSLQCMAAPLWHCTATNDKGALWSQYADSHMRARELIERDCKPHNNRKTCAIICFPPKTYWRCVSHDTLPTTSKTAPAIQQGSWYWTSFSKQIAVNGARDACRHNSAFAGCYVDPDACASS